MKHLKTRKLEALMQFFPHLLIETRVLKRKLEDENTKITTAFLGKRKDVIALLLKMNINRRILKPYSISKASIATKNLKNIKRFFSFQIVFLFPRFNLWASKWCLLFVFCELNIYFLLFKLRMKQSTILFI